MGVDQRSRDRRAGPETKVAGGLGGQAGAERGCRFDDAAADAGVVVFYKLREPDRAEVAIIPTLIMRQIGPLQVTVQIERAASPLARWVR